MLPQHVHLQHQPQNQDVVAEDGAQDWPGLSEAFLSEGVPQPLLFDSPQMAEHPETDDVVDDSFFAAALGNEGGTSAAQSIGVELFGEEKMSGASFDMANMAV